MEVNWLAVFIASLAGPLVGYLWYTVLFEDAWMKYSRVTDEQMKKGMLKRVVISYLLTLAMSFILAVSIGPDQPGLYGLTAGFVAGFGWIAMALGSNYAFEHKPLKLWLINAGYNILLLSIMGLIIGMF